ncbi:MAG: hypothetical protein HYT69_00820 [Candidatus Zambryskibacteria bacterium]|nr:hypothetical protein [Candidatus Zambryskibacteria bacterium]
MAEIDDYKAFGDFLSEAKAKVGKNFTQLESEIGMKCLGAWHTYNGFPARKRLPVIALAYGVDLDELTLAYEKGKVGRQAEMECRREPVSRCRTTKFIKAANYDLPASGRVSGRTHSFRNSGGR